jgi:ABC-type transport system involved in cytochrome c biogenesis permease subunit
MAPDAPVVHALIYAAMLAYLLAGVAFISGRRRWGGAFHASGFVVALVAFVVLWGRSEHLPLQGLFGVFLCLGALMYPLSAFCRRFLGVEGRAGDALIGFALFFPAAFVFKPGPGDLMPALQSPLMGVHVGAYLLAYAVLFKAGVQACKALAARGDDGRGRAASRELDAFKLVRLGFPLLTLGLVLGAVWGSVAWGDYWQWDPKELWSLAMWLVYAGYFQVRSMSGARRPRLSAAIAVVGAVVVVATILWVNLARIFAGLHSYAA